MKDPAFAELMIEYTEEFLGVSVDAQLRAYNIINHLNSQYTNNPDNPDSPDSPASPSLSDYYTWGEEKMKNRFQKVIDIFSQDQDQHGGMRV